MEIHNDRIKEQFDLRAPSFDRSVYWVTDPELISAHIRMAGRPQGPALELCCGTGAVARGLKGAGWDVTGVDLSEAMIEEAKRYIPAQVGDATNLPFFDRTFDLVVMRQAYFLLDNGPAALKEISRVLKTGGRLILSHLVPFSDIDTSYLQEIHTVKQAQMRAFHTTETLKNALETAGFNVIARDNVTVRESVTLWMNEAPELSPATRARVCEMVTDAPTDYRNLRNVKVENGEIREDWNFVLLLASRK